MKEHTETINESIFSHFPTSPKRKGHPYLSYNSLKRRALAWKEQAQNGIAALGIGTVILLTIYLFFTQLAEYGWR